MSVGMIAAVLVAGTVGAVLRWATTKLLGTRSGFPRAVLLVNLVGSALAGTVFGIAVSNTITYDVYLLLVTGFCGGLTTFSTFSVDTVQLVLAGRIRTAVTNALTNLLLGIAAAAIPFAILSAILPPTITLD